MSQLPFNSSWLTMSRRILRITFFFSFLFSFFILKAQNVGINTLDPKAGLHVVSNNGILATGTLDQGIVQDSGVGTRLMWIPYLGAFRAGGINGEGNEFFKHRWDPDSIGQYSFAGGVNTRASGRFSFAYGNRNMANGDNATSIGGFENIASGRYSFATGLGNRAPSAYEAVFGSFASLYTPNDPNGFDGGDRLFDVGAGVDADHRIDALTILKNGNVGINKSKPLYPLHVYGESAIDSGRLLFINTGSSILIGDDAGQSDDHTNNRNILIGNNSGKYIVNGFQNIGIGTEALFHADDDIDNIGIGQFALFEMIDGSENVAIGTNSLLNASAGWGNTAVGISNMEGSTTGHHNSSFGHFALFSNGAGYNNVAIGEAALFLNQDQTGNVAVGQNAGHENNKSYNTFLGQESGHNNNGHHNVFIGNHSGQNDTTSNTLIIDNSNTEDPLIYGDFANNKVFINDSLGSKYLQLTNGATDGYVLKSDASGNGSWVAPATIFSDDWTSSGNNIYNNNSQNVGIGTVNPSEKLHVTGNMNVETGRIYFSNNGLNTFVGAEAGLSDNMLTNHLNTFIGRRAGKSNTTGGENTAIGADALKSTISSGQNVAVGNGALASNTTGPYNTALGYSALGNSITGNSNIGIGYVALKQNNGTSNISLGELTGEFNLAGSRNIFIGPYSGQNNLGSDNIFLGNEAGRNETGSGKLYIANSSTTTPLIYGDFSSKKIVINDSLSAKFAEVNSGRLSFLNTGQSIFIGKNAGLADDHTANNNVMIGEDAGKANTSGANNIAIGTSALDGETTSNNNIAIGKDALGSASLTGEINIAIGNSSLSANTTGENNVAVGQNSLGVNVNGNKNVAIGQYSLDANISGSYNAAIGYDALGSNTTGEGNIAMGYKAGEAINGINNTILGTSAGISNSSGDYNTMLGNSAGISNVSGSGNLFLGYSAGYNETGSNKLYISNSNTSSPLIYGDFAAHEITINDSLTVNKELGIGTSTPNSTLEVNGTVAAKFKTPLAAGTDNPDGTGMVWRYTSGTGTITLPAASTCANRMYVIINQTGATRTISSYRDLTTTPQTTISSSVALWVMSDGTNWYQIK